MKQYKVIALSVHLDKVQRIFETGDIINSDILLDGQAEQLIEGGFIVEVTAAQETEAEEVKGTAKAKKAVK